MTTQQTITTLRNLLHRESMTTTAREAILQAIRELNPGSAPSETIRELIETMQGDAPYKIGEIALDKNGYTWRLINHSIDKDERHHLILMTERIVDYAPFARPTKEHPYGWNNYMESQIRREMNEIWLGKLMGDEADMLNDYQGMGKLFLMSEGEVGFRQEEEAFDYFRGEDKDALDEKRSLTDMDGDKGHWWLRSPYPGIAYYARRVNTSGALRNYSANYGFGAEPACEIIF